MAKNNHRDDNIQSKLDRIFFNQDFTQTDPESFERYLSTAALYATVENGIAVLSDLKTRTSYLFYGYLGERLGIAHRSTTKVLDTIWEEEILSRIAPDDIRKKQTDELIFFSYASRQEHPDCHCMTSWIRMADANGIFHDVRHRIFYFREDRSIRYALCLYNAACGFHQTTVTETRNGRETLLSQIAGKEVILSAREIEVLGLISRGLSSKEIARELGISVFTVSRHRQNIISAMNVRNSTEACKMAAMLGLL